ncbi:hypothetical protein F383_29275 [Gossypium arboreum]|uniref:Uncharacterized protein n=1 Tax=Gossypium arboreum TaxID=29729 RepID=A0A0B0P7D0_GOSAR|nr:hypothetical protein F383_19796 [Gossypium arboreum]KHG22643.1 hypothetical protein F383_29275 [Gossypium arboreum]
MPNLQVTGSCARPCAN